ncbi:MAG: serpin family protein [Rhodothermaceae bacterium]
MLKKATYCLLTSLIVAAVVFVITLIGCSPEQIQKTEQKIGNEKYFSENQTNVLECNSEFGFKLLKQLNNSKSVEENVFISPLSISVALQTLLNGAESETYDEIVETLGFTNSIGEINQAYKNLLERFTVQNSETIVRFSDSVCLNSGMACKNEFLKTGKKVYGASFNLLGFLNTSYSKEMKTAIYSKNSASFSSVWKNKFNTDEKINLNFEKINGEVRNIEFMTQKDNYHFYKDDLLSYVEIPYGSDSLFSMSIILPTINRDVNQVISELDNRYWNYIISHRNYLNGQLIIPKFGFSYEARLKHILKNLGINKMFSGNARFKKIYDQNIFIDQIVHNSSIEINEKGLKSSEVSAFEMIKYSVGSAFYLIANRPFLVLIKENLSNEVLFVGKLVNP